MNVKQIVEEIVPAVLKEEPDLIEKLGATYRFVIEGAGTWFLDLTKPGGELSAEDKEAECDIETSAEDMLKMSTGELNTQMAFLSGQFRTNNPQLAVRLNALIEGIMRYVSANNLG